MTEKEELEIGLSIHTDIEAEAEAEADVDVIMDLTLQLRDELRDLDLETIKLIKGPPAPENTKALESIVSPELLMTLAASGGVITTLINTVQSWITRHKGCRVTLKIGEDFIDAQGISSEDQQKLIETWIKRHT